LKVGREVDDVTSASKLFHIRAATTGNARSPTVASRVGRTAKAEVDNYYINPLSVALFRLCCRPNIYVSLYISVYLELVWC